MTNTVHQTLPEDQSSTEYLAVSTEEDGVEDGVEEEQLSGPQRRCVVLRVVSPKEQLLRFVVDPQGCVVFDLQQRLPGRGIWLSARQDVVNTAIEKRVFARIARRSVQVSSDLALRVQRSLEGQCLNYIALARRAGEAVCGFEKVRSAIRSGSVGTVLAAQDGAADGRDKMMALAGNLPVVDWFKAEQLGVVFGRDTVVHAAIMTGGLSRRVRQMANLLRGFMPM